MFGQIKPYKGLDVLIEALGQVPQALRQRARVVIAGAAHMDMAPIKERIAALGLEDVVELRLGRLDETQMVSLRKPTASSFPTGRSTPAASTSS